MGPDVTTPSYGSDRPLRQGDLHGTGILDVLSYGLGMGLDVERPSYSSNRPLWKGQSICWSKLPLHYDRCR